MQTRLVGLLKNKTTQEKIKAANNKLTSRRVPFNYLVLKGNKCLHRGLSAKQYACQAGGLGLIPESRRSPVKKEKIATHTSILPWEIPWTEDPGDL